MFLLRSALSATGVLESVICSCLVAELAGYWLHRLLHSDKMPFLSRNHLIHHFLVYGPGQPMRAEDYRDATHGRFSIGNIGLEWLLPSSLVLAFCWCVMFLFGVPAVYQMIVVCNLILWPIFTFSYLHDRMHVQNFWMARTPLIKVWFIKARRLHDIHHRSMSDSGHMNKNFGIGFFFFDCVFKTIARRHRPFNRRGYEAAVRRYGLEQADSADGLAESS